MLTELINPLTVLMSFTAIISVFIHDTRIDKALIVEPVGSSVVSNYRSTEVKIASNDQHIHSESVSVSSASSLNSQQPSTQPRNQDDKKYIAQKRLMGSGSDNEYSWPSI